MTINIWHTQVYLMALHCLSKQHYSLQQLQETRASMGLDALLENQLGYWPQFQKFPPNGSKLTLFRSTGSRLWDMSRFQNCHIGMKLGHWPKFQKLHIYSLSTPWGQNWAYFCSTGSSFTDMDRFSKLPYLGMKLGHFPKCQKLHIYSLCTPGGRN